MYFKLLDYQQNISILPSPIDQSKTIPKIFNFNKIVNQFPKKENKNGILAIFRKDVKKKRNLIEKELQKLKKHDDSTDNLIRTKFKQILSKENRIENNKSNEENKLLINDDLSVSQPKRLKKTNSETQSMSPNKKIIFPTELIEDNEFPRNNKVLNEKSYIYSKNVSSLYGDLRSTIEIPHLRMRRNKIEYIPRWYEQNKIPVMNFIPALVNDLEFQTNLIKDEVKVLLSDIQKFRIKLLQDPYVLRAFRSQDTKVQTKFNLILEESYMLMMEITKLLIEDFVKFLEKITDIEPPNLMDVISKTISKEISALVANSNLFNEVTDYFLNCYEVYNTLIKQVDNMILPYKQFVVVLQFFARCRMNISKLTYYCNNFVENYLKDKDLMSKYLSKNKAKENTFKKSKFLDVHKVDSMKKKMKDLNNVLKTNFTDEDIEFEKKKKNLPKNYLIKLGIESKLFDKIIKYSPKDVKQALLTERLIKQYKIRSEDF